MTTYSTKQNNKFAWKEILTLLSSDKEIQAVPNIAMLIIHPNFPAAKNANSPLVQSHAHH
jgi:hypothetical protein